MSLNLIELTRGDIVKVIANYIENCPYLFIDEIADSLRDGSWIEHFNGENSL